jgi:hypothetical protein
MEGSNYTLSADGTRKELTTCSGKIAVSGLQLKDSGSERRASV